MKNFILFLFMLFIPFSCFSQNSPKSDKEQSEMKPSKNEDGEWDLIVIDTQFDYFLNAIAKPVSQYSEAYLKTKNSFLVNEWNGYYNSGKYRNIIESRIDYDPQENYGIKFEYKLYQVFAYVNWKYGLKMKGLSGSDAIR
ncbi:DUF6146 family protein [Chryseobacterium gallinarum]|uniref:Uncharacterized protein n=1 Tax=Chryseobacterium gallinarum TaxID=1324352 RepID=A0A0G3M0S6_CHRGL|nr:DUF6146 family protein [Chryseobacterium gallinarum]AKK72781.1 hypothetical protein OK18_09225 [Chryseobacterium gallinarum]MCL8536396.1 DUF6146 family protein [Chryseobacterium gallinarum]QIY91478.1 hypothetical protein FOB44_12845 [Chryseobacterium gallinarum]